MSPVLCLTRNCGHVSACVFCCLFHSCVTALACKKIAVILPKVQVAGYSQTCYAPSQCELIVPYKEVGRLPRTTLLTLPQLVTAGANFLVPTVENPELANVLPLKPGVGQNIAMHASPAARSFFLVLIYAFPFHSTSFFSKYSPSFLAVL